VAARRHRCRIRLTVDRADGGLHAEELGLSADEALRQMSTLVFLSGTEQLGSAYLGTRNDPGALADVFLETALFLEEQDTIRAAPDLAVFQEAIRPEFLEQAVAPDGE
jgi:taurine transport system substrate-binding protein